MSHCELCGKETQLLRAEIEGTNMLVCRDCTSFGQVKENPQAQKENIRRMSQIQTRSEPHLEVTERIVSDYAQKIKNAREKLRLNQEDFAKKINEKESLLHKMETGSFEPSLSMAKKLEKVLNIRLVEKIEEKNLSFAKISSEGMTIGDLIKK